MFKIALASLALVATAAYATDTRTYGPDEDGETVLLTAEDCTLPIVGAPVPLYHARLTKGEGQFSGCWAEVGDGAVRIVWEPASGYQRWVKPSGAFRKLKML